MGVLSIPPDAKTYTMRSSIIWFDENGILYSVPRPEAPTKSSDEEIREDIRLFMGVFGGQKRCIILEADPRSPAPPREQRDLISEQLNKVTKALAIITSSPVTRMIANLFFSFKPPDYPSKTFTDPAEAKNWIKQYL